MSQESTWSLKPTAAHRLVGGEYFVVTGDRAFHHIHVPSAVTLFRELTAGPCTSGALVSALVHEFDVAEDVAAQDVQVFVATLVDRQLAVPAGEVERRGGGPT